MSIKELSPILRKRIDKYFSNIDKKLRDGAYLGAPTKLADELRHELKKEKESYEIIYSGNLMRQIFLDPEVISQFYDFINKKIANPGRSSSYKDIETTNLYGKEDKAFTIKNMTYSHAKTYMEDFIEETIIDESIKKTLLTRLKDFQIGHVIGLQSLRALNTFNISTNLEDLGVSRPGSTQSTKIVRIKNTGNGDDMSSLLNGLAQLLLDLDLSTTNSLEHNLGFYAHSFKSLKTDKIDALLELQLTDSATELANRSSGTLAREISSIVKIEQKVGSLSKISIRKDKKGITKLALVLEKYEQEIRKAFEKIPAEELKKAALENLQNLVNMKSSDSLKEMAEKNLVSIIRTGKGKNIIFDTGVFNIHPPKKVKFKNPFSSTLKSTANALKDSANKMKVREIHLRTQKGRFASPISIMNLINGKLAQQIQQNMGKGNAKSILNYRTGRFAESAKVTNISSRSGYIDAFYTYMKNPYQTFEPGFAQGSETRDPRKLIQRSIRQIAAELVANRLRVIPV